ncbi:uncharacterized protein G2W53_017980 [Senna tora]|uniref:Uncharacterized protein n=1 Tax=Senna tora TaxID=362788 RepID=A0A834TUA3_9FABA|nr:uncharacterized protein G2W53_017980 [Senna tora]
MLLVSGDSVSESESSSDSSPIHDYSIHPQPILDETQALQNIQYSEHLSQFNLMDIELQVVHVSGTFGFLLPCSLFLIHLLHLMVVLVCLWIHIFVMRIMWSLKRCKLDRLWSQLMP